MLPIVSVAFLTPNGLILSLPRPARHSDLLVAMHKLGLPMELARSCDQGFLTINGTYLNREDARAIALKWGQVHEPTHNSRELFSEDLW